ncbi:uncharacterized protein N7473_003694 [Penicillium subrubescens]|uniref:uncharacterized protein n=1 Tax=Penicillium subrubescens TaxID=1316194 RepID=UPI0025455746|nr:uncharacterized protein N7473_003694 [Penicillium subrubescens]KAJ5906778.1 hypothetical protein N7473_003694 [Penicillium subrubescens]
MREFQTAWLLHFGISVSVAATSASDSNSDSPAVLNFRPENVTLSGLYHWVGCDPVNAFFALWPVGFNFSTLPLGKWLNEISSLDYGIFSSNPVYDNSTESGFDNFVWSTEENQASPYNLSSVLTDYQGFNDFLIDSTTTCLGVEILQWQFAPIPSNGSFNGSTFTNPVIDLQFDSRTANLSMRGYFEASPQYTDGVEDNVMFAGKLIMNFSGVIDHYHSDILRNDMDTPTWVRTVGYQNNSLKVGYTTVSAGNQLAGSSLLATMLVLSQGLVFLS